MKVGQIKTENSENDIIINNENPGFVRERKTTSTKKYLLKY